MGTNRSFEERARKEVKRIKAEEERHQARMRELSEQARVLRSP